MAKAVKQFHDRLYETYEQKEIYMKKGAPARIRLRALLETLDELNGDIVLDIGCAEGVFTLSLAKKRSFCVGLDFVKISLNRLRAKALKRMIGNIDAVLSDAHYLPIRDKCFDVVLCSEVLEHVLEPSKVLNELRRVTNSWVVISVPCSSFANQNKFVHRTGESVGFHLETILRNSGTTHIHVFTPKLLYEMVKKAGLRIYRIKRVFFTVPGLRFLLAFFSSFEYLEYLFDQRYLSKIPVFEARRLKLGNRYVILQCRASVT